MKRRIFALFLACMFLTACTPTTIRTDIQVYILPGEGVIVQNNGLWIQPGADAVFRLHLRQGYEIAEVDYWGAYDLILENGTYLLTLRGVAYPTGVAVTAEKAPDAGPRAIVYQPNGGEGEPVQVPVFSQRRPNTQTDLFADRDSR